MKRKFLTCALGLTMIVSLVGCNLNLKEFGGADIDPDGDVAVAPIDVATPSPKPAPDSVKDPEPTSEPEEEPEAEPEEEPEAEPETKPQVSGNSDVFPEELSDDIYSYQIQINGVVYQFPMYYSDFESAGWTSQNADEMVGTGSYALESFKNGKISCSAYVLNLGINNMPEKDCLIGGLMIDNFNIKDSGAEVVCPGGFVLGDSNLTEVIECFGDPSDLYVNKDDVTRTATYKESSYCDYRVRTFESDIIHGFDIQNFVEPEGFDPGSVDDSIPEAVEKYEAPTEMSDNLFDYVIKMDGVIYDLPCPVSAFVDNGWTIVESKTEEIIEGGGSGKVTLRKNNKETWTYVRNMSPNATTPENCFVTDWEVNVRDFDFPLEFAGGIENGDTFDEVQKKLDDMGVEYEIGEDNQYISVADDFALTFHIDFSFDTDGTMRRMGCQCPYSRKQYCKMMGYDY